MADSISFIHAADLHLDSPFKGMANAPESIFNEIKNSTFIALDNLVTAAIDKAVDFLLIAGDLFDNERQSLKAQIRLRKAFERLERHHIHVYLSYGNHDYINGNKHPVEFPGNVHVFPDEKVSYFTYEKEGKPAARIYGFSYVNRAVVESKAPDYQIVDKDIPYHIAMLHGSLATNTEHDVYAPFQLADLTREDFDYWALGHIHKRQILKESPAIVYPGNVQGRHRKETGEKGCCHVTITGQKTALSFIPLQAIEFRALALDVTACGQVHDLEKFIWNACQELRAKTPLLLDLTLKSESRSLQEWANEKLVEETIDLINETISVSRDWRYIFRTSVQVPDTAEGAEPASGSHFIGELSRNMEDFEVNPYVKELYQHRQFRKHMDTLLDEEAAIKNEAKKLLINELLKG